MSETAGNHLLPFFWQHGEDTEKLREYVGVIQEAGCQAFCVESRPHPDFCGPKWWTDMDAILDEAKTRNMKVWILDDSHFPTGYANGALVDADQDLCRQSLFLKRFSFKGKARTISFRDSWHTPPKYKMEPIQRIMTMSAGKQRTYNDDQIYRIAAHGPKGEYVDLTGMQVWDKPTGAWEILVCGLSRNLGPHRSYINMMDADSCRILLDAVYEPHFSHYKDYFGNTIAGFFSDEPELGNGIIYAKHNQLGTYQDLPWSRDLQSLLEKEYGPDLYKLLPCLFQEALSDEEKAFRVFYMDCVTKLVRNSFSQQIGDWCRTHGVEYIGHTVEDDDTHTCTGSGLGHFFRSMAGQDMAGIDDIGGQVIPQGEDKPTKALVGKRNGAFYHYTLPKLGGSLAALDSRKKGRCFCEIFGNYGWGLGVTDMKYLADHFMVNGVNYFVPHAFSPKPYPDPDCPPHFYANGHNPQYRHFGELCRYMNRVCERISDGEIPCKVAVYYNAESDWAGRADTLDKVARVLTDAQIEFRFLPLDYIDQASDYEVVIIPDADYVPEAFLHLPNAVKASDYPGDMLISYLHSRKVQDVQLYPANDRLRVLHYRKSNTDTYYFVNEGTRTYEGTCIIPVRSSKVYRYDAWEDMTYVFPEGSTSADDGFRLVVEPRKSLLLVFSNEKLPAIFQVEEAIAGERKIEVFERSLARSIDYPDFGKAASVTLPDIVEKRNPKFSGFIRYDGSFTLSADEAAHARALTITGLSEGVEVFINDRSAGIQIVPDYLFDIGKLVHEGKNTLRIECATTLARENKGGLVSAIFGTKSPLPAMGIRGEVKLLFG